MRKFDYTFLWYGLLPAKNTRWLKAQTKKSDGESLYRIHKKNGLIYKPHSVQRRPRVLPLR